MAGVTHSAVNDPWRAHQIAALACVAVYTVLVVFMDAVNEMLVAGMMLVGGLGYAVSMIMGVPIARYRRQRDRRAAERPADSGPG